MRRLRIFLATMAATLLFGCSPTAAIEKLAGAENKRDALQLAETLCRDPAALRPRFDPELWSKSQDQLPQVAQYCPGKPAKPRFAGYHWETHKGTDGDYSRRTMVVATESPGKWTTTTFVLMSVDGGPERIVHWNINAGPEKPADLAQLDAFEEALPYIRIAVLAVLLGLVGAAIWYIRRKRAGEA